MKTRLIISLLAIAFLPVTSLRCVATEPVVGNISGRLLTPTGSGLPNIEIHLFDVFDFENRQYANITKSDGAFTFTVPAGNWTLNISREQTPDFIRPSFDFYITETTNITGIEAKLLAADAIITGNIKDPNGQPVAGVQVDVARYQDGSVTYALTPGITDDAGNFTITAAKGSWFVFPDCSELLSRSFDCTGGINVDATPGSASANFSLTTGAQPIIEAPRVEFTRVGDTGYYMANLVFTLRGEPGGYDIQSRDDIPRFNYSWNDVNFVTIPKGATSAEVRIFISTLPTLPFPTLPHEQFFKVRRRLAAP
jgi:hypothetical protein